MAANKQDLSDAWELEDMRIALRLDPKIKFLPCVATDKESVKTVLLELLYSILSEMEATEVLYQIYKSEDNADKALFYHEKYRVLQDSLSNEQNIKKITRIEADYQFEQEKKYRNLKLEGHSKKVIATRMGICYQTLQKSTAGW